MVVDGGKWRPFRFRSPSGMTSFSVSCEVTSRGSDLIQYGGNGKWGHPRWWPEAERPPFSTIHNHGVPKTHPILLLRPDDHWNAPNRKCIDKVGYQSNNDLFCKMKMRSLFCFIWVGTGRADQRKHQSSASLAFVRGIHRWPVNSPHKWPVTRKMFPFDDVVMNPLGTH